MATAELYEKALNWQESPAGSTRCFRCTGLMVAEESFDSMVDHSRADFLVRRCVQCGEVIDPVILQNRQSQLRSDLGRTSEGRLL